MTDTIQTDGIAALLNKVKMSAPKRGAQAVLAEDLNVSEAFIAKCIRRRWFPVERAKELSTLYNVPAMELVKPRLRDDFADMTARS